MRYSFYPIHGPQGRAGLRNTSAPQCVPILTREKPSINFTWSLAFLMTLSLFNCDQISVFMFKSRVFEVKRQFVHHILSPSLRFAVFRVGRDKCLSVLKTKFKSTLQKSSESFHISGHLQGHSLESDYFLSKLKIKNQKCI